MTDSPVVHVAVGLLVREGRQVLVARRRPDSHQGGLWEFPGGKIEPGEPVFSALCREFSEELGVTVHGAFPLTRIHHDYGDKAVLLDVWTITEHEREPYGKEGQEIRWQAVDELEAGEFPAANAGIIRVLQLPAEIAITPTLDSCADWLTLLQQYRRAGLRAVQLRQKQLPAIAYQDWFSAGLARARGMTLFFNHDLAPFHAAEGAALHLSSSRLHSLAQRPVPGETLLSVSCHDAGELQAAERLGADLVLLSPVTATARYRDRTPLGWEQFRQLAGQVSLPVYALGGLTRSDQAVARASGAAGIAGISGFLAAIDQ